MKKKVFSGVVISIGISLLLLLTAFLSITLFENNYLEATADNNTVIANSMKSKIEYSIRYGKNLNNYFGIDDLFAELENYCDYYEYAFVTNADGTILYENVKENSWNKKRVEGLEDYSASFLTFKDGENHNTFIENREQVIMVAIRNSKGDLAGTLGFLYQTDTCKKDIQPYFNQIYARSIGCMLGGIVLFIIIYLVLNREFAYKKLLRSSVGCFLVTAVILGILCFPVFRTGYQEIADKTAAFYMSYLSDEIESVIQKKIHYDELSELDKYFDEICEQSTLIDSVELKDSMESNPGSSVYSQALMADELGNKKIITANVNRNFIPDKLRTIMISIFMTVVSATMIAGEAMIFLISVLTTGVKKKEDNTIGHVRGLSFFFSTFEYMATAFVSIVLMYIYQPITIWGYTIPKTVVMALPLSIEILTSMITSYLAGVLIQKNGWKKIAILGNVIMIVGTFLAGMSNLTLTFIAAQVVIGVGLGFEKTAIDLYAVFTADAKGESIEQYTAQANAGIMMGFSASSAVGGILADRFGYSGAYMAMGVIGIVVMILILFFGAEVKAVKQKKTLAEENLLELNKSKANSTRDLTQFMTYLLFVIVPYFFVMMFVDYFFPVYANKDGISTAVIGYVFLFYGMISSYGGTWLCNLIVKKNVNEIRLMTINMLSVGAIIAVFAFSQNQIFLLITIAIIAISDGVMPSLQYKYVSDLGYTKRKGMEMTIGIEGVFSSGIRGLAPMIFGVLMAIGDKSLMILGGVICLLALAFFANNRRKRG